MLLQLATDVCGLSVSTSWKMDISKYEVFNNVTNIMFNDQFGVAHSASLSRLDHCPNTIQRSWFPCTRQKMTASYHNIPFFIDAVSPGAA